MLIKCENCCKIYNVPDDKWYSLEPHFVKCFACGTVFSTCFESKNYPTEQSENVIPLAEIFTPKEEPDTVKMSDSQNPIFEPVKIKKQIPWQKIITGFFACITTVICVLFLVSVLRLYLFSPVKMSPVIKSNPFTFSKTQFHLTRKNNLFISGRLTNSADNLKQMPFISVLLKNEKNKVLQRQTKSLKKRTLDAKEYVDFNVSVKDIHPDAFKIEILAEENK